MLTIDAATGDNALIAIHADTAMATVHHPTDTDTATVIHTEGWIAPIGEGTIPITTPVPAPVPTATNTAVTHTAGQIEDKVQDTDTGTDPMDTAIMDTGGKDRTTATMTDSARLDHPIPIHPDATTPKAEMDKAIAPIVRNPPPPVKTVNMNEAVVDPALSAVLVHVVLPIEVIVKAAEVVMEVGVVALRIRPVRQGVIVGV